MQHTHHCGGSNSDSAMQDHWPAPAAPSCRGVAPPRPVADGDVMYPPSPPTCLSRSHTPHLGQRLRHLARFWVPFDDLLH